MKLKTQIIFGITVDWNKKKLWKKFDVENPIKAYDGLVLNIRRWEDFDCRSYLRLELKRRREIATRFVDSLCKALNIDPITGEKK